MRAGDGAQQRGLAGAVGADQRQRLAGAMVEADVAHRLELAVADLQILDGEQLIARLPPR